MTIAEVRQPSLRSLAERTDLIKYVLAAQIPRLVQEQASCTKALSSYECVVLNAQKN